MAINFAVEKKTLSSRSNLMKAFQRAKNGNGRFHFLGLVSTTSRVSPGVLRPSYAVTSVVYINVLYQV